MYKVEFKNFQIIKSLGKGGMGEVFLAFDLICKRFVALKRIKEELVKYPTIQKRFLREARIAAMLTHPSIIPIFSIYQEPSHIYYTMPYVEGKTLSQLLKESKNENDSTSIARLLRIFLDVCQAVAYTHSKGILHRDLKPDNILIGKFGEVVILDWGLAESLNKTEESLPDVEIPSPSFPELTIPGKIVGTLAYLAPERAKEEPASFQTDVYSLGVILYLMLTFKHPFKRPDLASFQKTVQYEEFVDPVEIAPYRDIPQPLSAIVKKSLEPSKDLRYKSVDELIYDLEILLEGKPDWLLTVQLRIENRKDWEFQENVLLARHAAVAADVSPMEWVSLMISKASFSGNTKIEALVRLNQGSAGIGFLLNILENPDRKNLMDGYCIWVAAKGKLGSKIFRSNIEVFQNPDVFLEEDLFYTIRIEKTDNHLRLFIDDILKLHYISHSPLSGTHVGLIYRDALFELKHLRVFIGSQNVMVSCLAIPDAFLALRNFPKALSEYRRIAYSFSGRTEGREALFRAGITLLEQACQEKKRKIKSHLFSLCLEEFGKLRGSAGAPLEYLGKSLVYKAMKENDEEIKCLELAVRKYPKHPLFPRLTEHVVFRLHESSHHERLSAYHFALLCLRHLPFIFSSPDNQRLMESIENHWETPSFLKNASAQIKLAYFLSKPITLLEIIESGKETTHAFLSLLELGCIKIVKENGGASGNKVTQQILYSYEKGTLKALQQPSLDPLALTHILQKGLDENRARDLLPLIEKAPDHLRLRALLAARRFKEAEAIFNLYASQEKQNERSPLYPLFGCFLFATKGEKEGLAHFANALETSYPKTTALLGSALQGKISLKKGWIEKAFFFEKQALFRDLALFHRCLDQSQKALFFEKQLKREKMRIRRIVV